MWRVRVLRVCLSVLSLLTTTGALSVRPVDGDVPVDPALKDLVIAQFSCGEETPFASCVSDGVTSLVETAGTGISFALVTGELPETTLGPLVISGENVELTGIETLSASGGLIQRDTLFMKLTLEEMDLSGDFKIKIPILGRRPVHLALHVENLRAPVAVVMKVKDDKLAIVDFNMKVDFDKFNVEINRGGPIVSKSIPFSGLINGLARSFLKGLTRKSVLQNKILPVLLKTLKPTLLKLINSFLQGDGGGLI